MGSLCAQLGVERPTQSGVKSPNYGAAHCRPNRLRRQAILDTDDCDLQASKTIQPEPVDLVAKAKQHWTEI